MPLIDQFQAGSFTEVIPYASVAYADGYFGSKMSDMAFWALLTAAEKLASLKEATLNIDQMTYIGRKLYIAQEREWPRYLNLGSVGDIFYLETRILPDVANATCEQAIWIARAAKYGHDHRARQEHQAQGLTGISRTGGQENYDLTKARRHPLCREALRLLNGYIARTGNLRDPYDPTAGFRSTF